MDDAVQGLSNESVGVVNDDIMAAASVLYAKYEEPFGKGPSFWADANDVRKLALFDEGSCKDKASWNCSLEVIGIIPFGKLPKLRKLGKLVDGADDVADATRATSKAGQLAAGANKSSVWTLGPSPRGLAIEEGLIAGVGKLPNNFKTFDQFNGGIATSIKSVDLSAKSYQDTARLESKIRADIRAAAEFDRYQIGDTNLTSSMIQERALTVAIQPGIASAAQMDAMRRTFDYGTEMGVTVRLVHVP